MCIRDSFATLMGLRLFDGELNDINGVPPIVLYIIRKKIEIDRNVQAISGVLVVNSYALIIFLL